jgi:hypothetical protein
MTMNGAMSFGGNSVISAPTCALTSNAPGNGFQFGSGQSQGGSSFSANAWSLVSAGGSTSFVPALESGKLQLTGPQPAFSQKPIANPYAALDNYTPQTNSQLASLAASSTCTAFKETRSGPDILNGASSTTAFCSTSLASSGAKIVLTPGTYFIQGQFSSNPGTSITCAGCNPTTGAGVTLVMVGRTQGGRWTPGTVDLKGDIRPNAPRTNNVNPNLNAVVVYAPGGGDITITANSTTSLAGAVVAPASNMTLNGNATAANIPISDCTVFITGSLQLQGTAGFDLSGCSRYGTSIPEVKIVRLVE